MAASSAACWRWPVSLSECGAWCWNRRRPRRRAQRPSRCRAYDDQRALEELARRCDVVTIEVEHVPVESLAWLAERLPVHPSPEVVAVGQDRLVEKQRLAELGISTAPWADAAGLEHGFPSGTILKRRTGGFDGRGQLRLGRSASRAAIEAATSSRRRPSRRRSWPSSASCRSSPPAARQGMSPSTPSSRTATPGHPAGDDRPAPGLSSLLQDAAARLVIDVMDDLGHVGVLALELFEVDGALLANEPAPRVHNSGHWTIEGAMTSQFEQHLRAICGLPGRHRPPRPGGDGQHHRHRARARNVLAVPGAHLHRYGKEPRPDRKIGHVTVVGADAAERDVRLDAVRAVVERAEVRPASSP